MPDSKSNTVGRIVHDLNKLIGDDEVAFRFNG